MVSAATIHVEPRRGSWVVREETGQDPVSEHSDATAATNAARERARRFAEVTVLLHDRYGRVRRVTVGARSRA
ncbi:MAG TPA: DUF2188 domain-containing protein [Solirubrobacteraceae bacterium]|nr:DUF2188 domain-containing protein [Solirubrobacteraceae bacterium]